MDPIPIGRFLLEPAMRMTHNLDHAIRGVDRLNAQLPFAIAVALTQTVKAAQGAMPEAVEEDLDDPTEFTKRGFYITPARKDRLWAVLGVKAKQAEYLGFQIDGGMRQPKRQALRLPSVVDLDQHGNLPPGLIRQLVNRAQQGKRATRSQSVRFGVSQRLDLFYGEPGDGRPAGIYKRVAVSATRHQLVPLVVFPKTAARYEKRFAFEARVRRIVEREFPKRMDAAWRHALATAR